MKSLWKVIRRYSLSAGLIIAVILCCNAAVILYVGYVTSSEQCKHLDSKQEMEKIGASLEPANDKEKRTYRLSEPGQKILEESQFLWALGIAPDGAVVWEWQVPDHIPRSYTLQDVASFSRWYLGDYPVRVWRSGELLLVFATDPQVESRHSLFMSTVFIRNVPLYLKVFLAVNAGVIVIFVLCFGWRFYQSMRPVAQGIEQLSRKQPLQLREKGVTAELAAKLNDTSRVLEEQSRMLARRDEARTEWISGVSHDIRTPLSLIVGYADRLAQAESLGKEEQAMAQTIRRQSMIIRKLVEDLNLTSKLSYDSQPLHRTMCSLAFLLRDCIADYYNEGLEQNFEIHVEISEAAEQTKIYADAGLISRALRNLIGNSLRHNPQGCTVEAVLAVSSGKIFCRISDSGPGIPEEIVQNIEKKDSKLHIMGLRLAAQITKAHGGVLVFRKRSSGTYDAELIFDRGW
ncbi:MAG: sensor histidine kinase [Lachnospiraceae bacterium]|uniref:sensor histidine kinase n=1 Tax=Parablautia sp. Marseille-Q6255 TaxID=3039593 RepID=UPI0024BC5543|nr:HAMP domain-containing sensor histidine kinase [Parablautia sp. Marseille-Q6255]